MPRTSYKNQLIKLFPDYEDYIIQRWNDEHWTDRCNWGDSLPTKEIIFDNMYEEIELMGREDYRNKLIKEFPEYKDYLMNAFRTNEHAYGYNGDEPVYLVIYNNLKESLNIDKKNKDAKENTCS